MLRRVWERLPPSIWIAFATFLILGSTSGLLGVSWPGIRLSFHEPLGALGLVLLVDMLGYSAASALSGPLAHRIGRGWLLFLGAVLALVGIVLVITTPWWIVLLAGYVLLGTAGGIYDGSINAHVSLVGSVRSMNFVHGLWGLGAAIGPQIAYVMSRSALGWRGAYLIVAALEVLLAATFLLTRPQWRVSEEPAHESTGEHVGPRPGLLILTLVAFFLYCGIEVAGGAWSYSLLLSRGTPGALAALLVTAYWAMLSAGRLLIGVVPLRLGPRWLVGSALGICLVGALLFLITPLGLPVLAFGLAPVFPTLMTLTPLRFGRPAAASVAGYQVGAATLGGGVFPAILGAIFSAVGIGRMPVLVLGAVIMMAVLVGITEATVWASARRPVPVA